MTARDTLRAAAALIAQGFTPEARATAAATTFDQLAEIVGGDLPLSIADLSVGLKLLSTSRSEAEAPNIAARRRTCAEIAALLGAGDGLGDPRRLAAVFRAVAERYATSVDPRHAAIRTTATREAGELDSEVRR